MNSRLKALITEYGAIALLTYLAIALVVVVPVGTAYLLGFTIDSIAGGAGIWLAVYVSLKLTQPVRIGVTILVTPIVAHTWRRASGRAVAAEVTAPEATEDAPATP